MGYIKRGRCKITRRFSGQALFLKKGLQVKGRALVGVGASPNRRRRLGGEQSNKAEQCLDNNSAVKNELFAALPQMSRRYSAETALRRRRQAARAERRRGDTTSLRKGICKAAAGRKKTAGLSPCGLCDCYQPTAIIL